MSITGVSFLSVCLSSALLTFIDGDCFHDVFVVFGVDICEKLREWGAAYSETDSVAYKLQRFFKPQRGTKNRRKGNLDQGIFFVKKVGVYV